MDEKSIRLLEFDKVLARVAEHTSFSAGTTLTLALQPSADPHTVETQQAQTRQAIKLLEGDDTVSVGGARDVRPAADNALRGFVLLSQEFLEIKNSLVAGRNLKRTLLKNPDRHPNLAELAELIEECPGLVTTISQTIDDRGEVQDTASPKLATLRRELRDLYAKIQEKLRILLNSSSAEYLQEPIISLRQGRYVVPLRAEHKGRIKGIIHDQSASGATLWIEPLHTVDLNNNYRSHQIAEEKEIERILGDLSLKIAQWHTQICQTIATLAQLDCIFARAKYAMLTDAVEPQFVAWRSTPPPHPGSRVWIRGARHPLLNPATVIPTDFLVPDDVFTVLITGPNTGGKTVSLKNLGLMISMAQSGLHLPANEAQLTIFEGIFADIGDEQSIEQSLSTFSAHITNIIRILGQMDARSLVVLDELGSGTDPTEGAAIAQAIINYLRDKGATALIATHYPELKIYASQTAGATNASMLFDIETLSPTYEMTIGIPGKSNALAIARRLGLDDSILDEALKLIGHDSQQAENLIGSIYDLREKIASEEAATRIGRQQVDKLRDQLQIDMAAVEYERRKILREAREQAERELEAVRDEVKRARKQLRDAQSLNAVKKLSESLTESAENKDRVLVELETGSADDLPSRRRLKRLQVGDHVLVRALGSRGIITAIQSQTAEVAIGRLTMKVNLADLEFRERPEEEAEQVPPPSRRPSSSTPSNPINAPTVSLELDIRGERVEEALEKLDTYLDNAALAEMPYVRIIHGKGTGRLRQAVRKAIEKHPATSQWEEGRDGEGGDGVTVVKFS